MAGWIFLGGILNLLGIAYPLILDGVVLFGLVYSIQIFLRAWKLKAFSSYGRLYLSKNCLMCLLPSAVIILIVFIYCTHTLSSPKLFNYGDDLQVYLNHPIRMLATGTLRGSPLNGLGSLTFGGQAFLQGFALSHWPIGYVNTVDAVFAFILCLMVVLGMAFRTRLPFWFIPIVVAIPVVINPQYVNISAIYTTGALILFLLFSPWLDLEEHNYRLSSWSHAICLGMVYSALIVLKTTYMLVVVVHFTLLLLGFICISHSRKDVLFWAVKVIVSAVVFISPWILLYHSNWIALLSNTAYSQSSIFDNGHSGSPKESTNLFSLEPLFWGFGATFAHYTYTVILSGFCGFFLLVYKFPSKLSLKMGRLTGFAACAMLPILYFVNIIIIAPLFAGPETSLRYTCPVIIAVLPSALIIVSATVGESIKHGNTKGLLSRYPLFMFAVFSLVLLVIFSRSSLARVRQVTQYGSSLSFSKLVQKPWYIKYNQVVFSPSVRKMSRQIQQVIPEEETLIVWTHLGIHLDYRRNRIIDIATGALPNPWIAFSFTEDSSNAIKHFKKWNAHYLLWQYRSPAIASEEELMDMMGHRYPGLRLLATRTYLLTNMLEDIIGDSTILYDDGVTLVIKLHDKAP
jgi:hypothetical protein